MNASTNKIVDFQVVHVQTAGNSSLMEKTGLQILLDKFESLKISIASLTTDCHTQTRAIMRDYFPHISHQFDVWHFAKSIKKRLSKLAKKKDKKELNDWIKSIINHLVVLKEKWLSVLYHIRGIHSRKGNKHFKKCEHGKHKKRKWLKVKSSAFKALKSVVQDKKIIEDLKHLVEFRHTGN